MGSIITTDKKGDVRVLRFSFNEINFEQREELKRELNDQLLAGENKFVIDLSRVGFLSSLVLATILFFAKQVRKNKGEMKLCSLSGEAFGVVRLTQLDKIFEIYQTERDAVESFGTGG